jgi:hypothetical protein
MAHEGSYVKMNVRTMKGVSGKTYTVYAIKTDRSRQTRMCTRQVLFGEGLERPKWVALHVTRHGTAKFRVGEVWFYLRDFEPVKAA